MSAPAPPSRPPYYSDNETYGWPIAQCAGFLVDTLASFVKPARDFRGDAAGHIWCAYLDKTSARLAFSSNLGHGHVQLSVHESGWVRAEVFVSGQLKQRVWIDEPYEEKDFWPDGADGIAPPNNDPPGRISKRGRWLQLKCAAFPGAPDKGNGYWDVEDTED